MMYRSPITIGRFVALFLVAGALACDGETEPEPQPNRAPVAVGSIPPLTLVEGESSTVDASQNFTDPDGDQLTYSATSSDNSVLTVAVSGSNVTATAVAEGTVVVTITATDPDGLSASQTVDVMVESANQTPVATDTIPPQTLNEGDTTTINAADYFSDPDGDALTFSVESANTDVATAGVDGSVVTIIAVAGGTATVTVTATDPGGLSAMQEVMVTVESDNQAPEVADTLEAQTVTAGDTVTVDVSGGFSDADGDTLTFTATTSDTATATVSVDGAEVTIVGVAAGSATVTVTATDPGGLSAMQEVMVTVEAANQAPEVGDTLEAQTVTAGDTVTVDVSGGFSDPDGDTLTFTAATSDTATATVSVDGAEVTIVGVAAGSATVTVTATDPGGLSAMQEVMVTVEAANQAPEVGDTLEAQTVTAGDTVKVDVSGGFSDPDGDTLTFTATTSDTATATVSVSGSEVSIVGVAAGSATVTVTATDPGGLSAMQEVMVTVEAANQAPQVGDTLEAQTVTAGDTVKVDVSGGFSDPDGDTLTFTATTSDTATATVSVSGSEVSIVGVAAGSATVTVTATDPGGLSAMQEVMVTVEAANQAPQVGDTLEAQTVTAGDTVKVDVSGGFSDPDGDTLTYTTATSDTATATVSVDGSEVTIVGVAAGSATVTVTATDPGGLSAMQEVMVTVEAANQAPEVGDTLEAQTVTAGDTVKVDVSGGFSDPDGDTLTFTAATSDTATATVSVSGAEVTIVGVAAGSATVTVTATDPGGLSAMQEVMVTVEAANQAPQVGDTLEAQTVTAGDTVKVDVSGGFSDPDGDTLTFTAATSDTATATVSVDGAEVSIVGVAAGSATVTVTATDPGGLSAMQEVMVTVEAANQAPEVGDTLEAQTVTAGDTVKVDVSGGFSDPDGDTLTFTATTSDTATATVSVSGSEVSIVGVAAGSATVTVTATDPGGLSAMQEVMVTVEAANQAPEVGDTLEAQTVTAGDTVKVDVSGGFSDPDGDTLTYTTATSDTATATVSVSGSEVSIVGVAAGSATVTVTATDPGGLSAMQEVMVTVEAANQAPQVGDTLEAQTVTAGDTVKVDVSGGFSDPDGDTLTYTTATSDTATATVSVDGSEVTIVGVAAGSATVTVTATDPGGLSAMQTFDVTVAAAYQGPEFSDSSPVSGLLLVFDDWVRSRQKSKYLITITSS